MSNHAAVLSDGVILEAFEKFVIELAVREPPRPEAAKHGLEHWFHHAQSQMYFLSLRGRDPHACESSKPHDACAVRLDFVGKLEESEDHFGKLLAFLVDRAPAQLAQAHALWRRNATLRAAHGRDETSTGRLYERAGSRLERLVVPDALSPSTLDAIKSYYAQDMYCLRNLGYSWDNIERPKWHGRAATPTDSAG